MDRISEEVAHEIDKRFERPPPPNRSLALRAVIVACVVLGVPLASCSVPAEEEGGEVVAQQQQTFTEPQILENRYVWDDGTGMKSGMINVKVETLSVEQLAEIKASRGYNEPAEDFGKVSETPSDARNELIAWAAANPQATAKVILSLDEPVLYNWTAIRKAPVDSAARTSAIQAREAYTLSMLAGPTMSALQLGATNVNHYWIIPAMSFEIDTSVVSQLANWPAEWKVRLNKEILLEPNQYYTGIETRLGMIVKQFHVGGIFGQFGTRDPRGGPIRIGFFEAGQDLNWRHPGIGGWQLLNLGYYGNSRFGSYKRCTASACTTYQPSTVASHGTEVVGVALGTIEAGEDKQISNPTAREERSGIAPKAAPYYYAPDTPLTTLDTHIKIIQEAIGDGIDILNHSYSWGNTSSGCQVDKPEDPEALLWYYHTHFAGVLNVMSAGDGGTANGCVVKRPALYRAGLVVGGLNSIDRNADPHTLGMWPPSPLGGGDLKINGNWRYGANSLIDMVAPACFSSLYGAGGPSNATYHQGCGTSYAAPMVSGFAGLVSNAWTALALKFDNHAGVLLGATLLMTDGWAANQGGIVTKTGFDKRSGAGRVHAWIPQVPSLLPPFAAGCFYTIMQTGSKYSYYPMSTGPDWLVQEKTHPSVTMMKSVMYFIEAFQNDAADIRFYAQNTCPPGGGRPTPIVEDNSFDTRKRIRLETPDIQNACVQLVVEGVHVPHGAWFATCSYYHSGGPLMYDRH